MVCQSDRQMDGFDLSLWLLPKCRNRLHDRLGVGIKEPVMTYPFKLATYCQDRCPDTLS